MQSFVECKVSLADGILQGDGRSYSYCAALSSPADEEVDWEAATFLARIIPKVCHNVNRVTYVFGGLIVHPVSEITPTCLTPFVLALAREADHVAHRVLRSRGLYGAVAQMPVVVIPVQFDRDPLAVSRTPSCARSVVLRPFLSKDFMTGQPAIPGVDIPAPVSIDYRCVDEIKTLDLGRQLGIIA